jgi:hypothetical protein
MRGSDMVISRTKLSSVVSGSAFSPQTIANGSMGAVYNGVPGLLAGSNSCPKRVLDCRA